MEQQSNYPSSSISQQPAPVGSGVNLRQRTLMLLSVVVVLAVTALLIWYLVPNKLTRSVTTYGVGKVTFPASQIRIQALVSAQASTAAQAVADGESLTDTIISQLNRANVTNVNKSSYQIVPGGVTGNRSDYRRGLEITLSDPSLLDTTLSVLSNQNAAILQTRFLPIQSNDTRDQLLGAAVLDAQEKALSLAQQSNRRLGHVVSIAEVNPADPETGAATVNTGVSEQDGSEFSQIELRAAVRVTYALR